MINDCIVFQYSRFGGKIEAQQNKGVDSLSNGRFFLTIQEIKLEAILESFIYSLWGSNDCD